MPIVPPGHQVLVVSPSEDLGLSRLPSGPWVLSFGDGSKARSVLAGVATFLSGKSEPVSIIWIVTREVATLLVLSEELFDAAKALIKSREGGSHIMVFPDDSPERLRLMLRFQELGCGVHFGGPDRECYVEVHKPDGTIVVGMPGPALSASDAEEARAQGPLSATPLSDLITAIGKGGEAGAWERFSSVLLDSRLGVIAGGVPAGGRPGSRFQTGEEPVTLQLVTGPGGRTFIKACADPIAFRRKHPEAGSNVEMRGRDLLEMILGGEHGVLVCSATSLHSIPIDAAMAAKMLRK